MAGKTTSSGVSIMGESKRNVRLTAALSVLSLMPVVMPGCFAAELNLGSSDPNFTVDQNHQGTVNLTVNGEQRQVGAGSSLTAAEYAAFVNAIHGQEQTLNIGAGGVAVGGTLNLTPQLAAGITGLVVPTNVAVIHDFGLNSSLNLTGNLVNSGSFYAISTNSAVTNAVLSASNLTNNQGALLTSVLPTAGLAGIAGAISNLSLTLNIVNTLTNMGTISSAGNLNINAGAIYNQLPAGVTGVSPIMQAVNNLNLNATLGNITNQGILAATTGNVNLTSINNLVINNVNGSIQALVGNIDIHHTADILQTLNINAGGGDWLSRQLNIDAGYGVVEANLNDVTGQVNVNASAATLGASTPNLNLGNINITGDPTWFNTAGNVLLSGPIVASGASPNIAILASGHIISVTGATVIDSSSAQTGGNAGAITLVAGAKFSAGSGAGTNDTSTKLTINGGSIGGGGIYLDGTAPAGVTGATAITALTSAGSGGNNSGGNVTLVGYAGTDSDSGVIRLPAPIAVTTGGSGSGANGNFTAIAGASTGTTISTGGIVTSGSRSIAGTVSLLAATPSISGSGSVSIVGGTIQVGSGSFTGGLLQEGAISTGTIIASGTGGLAPSSPGSNAGSINISTRGSITTGALRAFGGGGAGGTGSGGAANATAGGNGGAIVITSSAGAITVNGDINVSGGGGGGGTSQAFGAGGAGGSVTISSTGSVTVSGPILAAGGGAGGATPFFDGTGGNGGGGSFAGGGGGSGGGLTAGGGGGGGGYTGGGGGGTSGNLIGGAGGGGGFGTGGGGGGGGSASSDPGLGGAGGGGGGIGLGGGGAAGSTGSFPLGAGGFGGAGGADGLPGSSPGTQQGGLGGTSAQGGSGRSGNTVGSGAGADGGNGGAGGAAGAGSGAGSTATAETGGNGSVFGVGGGKSSSAAQSVTGGDVGTSGAGGQISLSGKSVIVSGTIGTAAGDWPGFASSPFAAESISAIGTGGTITVTATEISVGSVAYSSNANYSSTVRSEVAPTITTLGTFGVGANFSPTGGAAGSLSAGSAITLNGVGAGTSVAAGTFQNTTNSFPLQEQGGIYTVTSGGAVSPAELVALVNAAQGTPGPTLNGSAAVGGAANGGVISISGANIPVGNFSNFNLPANVTANISAGSLISSGAATVAGTLNFSAPSAVLTIGTTTSLTGSINFNGTGGGTFTSGDTISGAGLVSALSGQLSVVSTSGNIGATGNPLSITVAPGTSISLSALAGSITVGSLNTSGKGGNGGSRLLSPQAGGNGGAISILAAGSLTTGSLRSFGGGGGGGRNGTSPVGGAGGAISLSSMTGSITVNGDVNSSGGGGGAAAFSGPGGAAGSVSISCSAGTLTVNGPILAAGGGFGSAASNGGAGGGGSFGGGGGGEDSRGAGGGGFYGGGGAGSSGNNLGGAGGGGGGYGSGGGGGGGGGGSTPFSGGGGGGGGGLGQGGGGGDFGVSGGPGGAGGTGGGDTSSNGADGTNSGTGVGGAGGLAGPGGGNGGTGAPGDVDGGAGGAGVGTGGGTGAGASKGGAFGLAGQSVNGAKASGNVGSSGAGGVINIMAASISLTGTIGAASTNWPGFAASSFAGDTINALGSGGTVSINATSSDLAPTSSISGNIRAGDTVHLQAATNIGSSLLPAGAVSATAPNISAVAAGFVNITNTFSLSGAGTGTVTIAGNPVTMNSSAGTDFILTVPNALLLTSSAPLSGQNVILTTGQATGSIIAGANITTKMNVTLNSPTVGTNLGAAINGASVIIANTHNSDLTIANAGSITATTGSITASSPAGMNLNVTGGGTLNALIGGTTLTATTSGATANNVNFTGSQTFNGATFLNATGANQSVFVAPLAVVTGNNLLQLNTPTLNNLGTITGNPLILFTPAGLAGTIANSAGSVDLNSIGNLTFVGQSLAILSAGSILNSGGARTINLSTANANTGGSLTLVAGFNFNPGTGGTVGPVATPFTLTTAGSGNINLSNVAINTSSTSGSGGTVLAVANGSVTLGNITTTGPGGLGGAVTVIGTGVSTGAITSTGLAAGAVSLTSAPPVMSGPVTVTNGVITAGGFVPGALGGNIFINAINAGSANITLSTGGAGLIGQLASPITTTGLLTINAGTSFLLLNVASSRVSVNTTTGSAFLTATGTVNLETSTVGGILSLAGPGVVGTSAGAIINVGGTTTLNGTSGIAFGANTVLNSTGGITLSAFGAASAITVGNNVAVTSGKLAGGAPPSPAGLTSANIQNAGSLMATAGGSGGIAVGNNTAITINGGSLTLSSGNAAANIDFGDNYSLQVNGGMLSLSSGNQINLGPIAGTAGSAVARTLNGFSGTISTMSTGNTRVGANSNLFAGSSLTMNSFGMTSGITFNTGSTVTANSATISSSGNGGVTLAGFTAANNLSATSSGALTSNGAINAGNVTFNTFGMNQPITVNQAITVTPSGFNTMPTIALNSSGNVLINGVLSGNRVNLTSSGNAASAITLAQPINGTGANNQVTFTAFSGAAVVNNVGAASTITANVLNINSSGAVGVAGAQATRINTQVDTLNLSGFGAGSNVAINELNGLTIGSFGSASVGGSLEVVVDTGNLTFQSINAGNNIRLTATLGNITQLAGGFVSNQTGGMDISAPAIGAALTLNGSFSASGTGAVNITTAGTIGAIGSVTANNGVLTVTASGGSLTQTNFTTLSTNTGNIFVTGLSNVLLNGSVRTNTSGSILVTATTGSVTSRGLSTGFTGSNDITVNALAPNGTYTALPNSFSSAGMNGSISLNAAGLNGDITLTDASFNTTGTGTITVTANRNVVIGQLSSGGGLSITAGTPIGTGSITSGGLFSGITATNGNISLNQLGPIGQINLGGDVVTTSSGTITIGANGAGGVTVRGVRTGLMGPNSITIAAPNGPLTQQPFTSVSSGTGGATILTGAMVSLQNVMSGGTFTGASTLGTLTLGNFASVSGTTVSLSAPAGITLNGMVSSRAGLVDIASLAAITVNQSVSAMGGPLSIVATNGALTTGASAMISATGGAITLQANNAMTGAVTLGASVTANGTTASNIAISSGRAAAVGSLMNNTTGSINITANVGTLQLNGALSGRGDVTIRHNGIAAGDRIIVGPSVSIFAIAPSAPQGNISIAITTGSVTNVAGVVPAGGTVSQFNSGGGQIFFGPGQFTNSGFTTLNAKGANITFFRDAAAADGLNAIQLNSNFLFADPPTTGFAIPSPTAAGSVPIGAQGAGYITPASNPATNTLNTPSSTQPLLVPNAVQGLFDAVRPMLGVPSQNTAAPGTAAGMSRLKVSAPGDSADLTTQTKEFAGAVVQSALTNANSILTGFVSKKTSFFGGGAAYIRSAEKASVSSVDETTFDLARGEIVLSASRRTAVNAGIHSVDIAPGAVAHVVREEDVLKVRSLCDTVGKAVHVRIAGKALRLAPGEEIVIGTDSETVNASISQDKIGRRDVHRFVVDSKHHVVKSELSVTGLIQKSNLLSTMYSKGTPTDRSIMERVIKMAAALFQVTGRRGAYSAYEPNKSPEVTEIQSAPSLQVAVR